MTTIQGVDISNNNGTIAWHSVTASGYEFGMMKRSEGADYADAFFPANWAAAPAVGMGRGAYHFCRPSAFTALAEADYFCGLMPPLEVGDVLAADFEDENVAAGVDLAPWLLAWLQEVEAKLSVKPLIYGGLWYLTNHNIIGNPVFAPYGLWFSSPGGTLTSVAVPALWDFIAMLQTSWNGVVPGINGKVDLDVFAGTLEQFKAYGYQQPAPKPVPVPPVADNNDLEQLHRLVDAQPFDAAPLVAYASRFVPAS